MNSLPLSLVISHTIGHLTEMYDGILMPGISFTQKTSGGSPATNNHQLQKIINADGLALLAVLPVYLCQEWGRDSGSS